MSQPEERLRPHPSERLSGPAVLLNLPEFTQALYAEPHPSKQGHRQVSLVHRGRSAWYSLPSRRVASCRSTGRPVTW
jgi:hypothetical protein